MKSWQLLIAATLVSLCCAPRDVNAASIHIAIDNQSTNVPLVWRPPTDRARGYYEVVPNQVNEFVWKTDEGSIKLQGALDPDPSLIFGSVAFDFGAPSTFSYMFILPLAPLISNPSFVSDSFAGSVTNGMTAGGVTVTALPPPPGIPEDGDGIAEMQVYTLSDDGGLTWKNVGLDVGTSETISPLGSFESAPTTSYNLGPIPTIAGGPWTHMRADINFRLSGGGDVFTFNGAKVLVPEPGTLVGAVMLLGGLLCRRSWVP